MLVASLFHNRLFSTPVVPQAIHLVRFQFSTRTYFYAHAVSAYMCFLAFDGGLRSLATK